MKKSVLALMMLALLSLPAFAGADYNVLTVIRDHSGTHHHCHWQAVYGHDNGTTIQAHRIVSGSPKASGAR